MCTKTFGLTGINSIIVIIPKKSQYFNKTNKKVIGKFKDDAAGILITEVTGLRSKMYSYVKDNNGKGAW